MRKFKLPSFKLPLRVIKTRQKSREIPEEVVEARKNVKSIIERFYEVKKIGEEPPLVSPEQILGRTPKSAADYFKPIGKYGQENKHTG